LVHLDTQNSILVDYQQKLDSTNEHKPYIYIVQHSTCIIRMWNWRNHGNTIILLKY